MPKRLCETCPLNDSPYMALCDEIIDTSEIDSAEATDAAWLEHDEKQDELVSALTLRGVERCSRLREVLPKGSILRRTKHSFPFASCPEMALLGYRIRDESFPDES